MTPLLPSGGRTPAAVLFVSAILLGTASQAPAQTPDTTLPEITVTAPSPIARRSAPRHAAPTATPA
ncbi:MAG: hypothetical protein WBA66_10375, partial [Xanthobacteraceae bacterium]